ncbi:MAG: DUF429 domain-containing protein [Candidatus Margulisiibacteriota bacterium]
MINAYLYGIDGCRTGWVVTSLINKAITISHCESLNNYSFLEPAIIVIDMPLHCPTQLAHYPRICDKNAKAKLGRGHSRVFYAPLKVWLNKEYQEINVICEQNQKPKLSKQSFFLFKKIKELNLFFDQNKSLNIHESHPELVFQYLNGGQLAPSKKTPAGLQLRRQLIKDHLPPLPDPAPTISSLSLADDIYDACAMLWVAININSNPF